MLAVSGWSEVYKPEPYSPELIKKAEQGDEDAQTNLGWYYYEGKIVPQDYKEAVKWFTKAAEQGNAEAQLGLGDRYYFGQGVTKDYKEAVRWYTKSAEQGYVHGQRAL
jgi:TPR repeat protein